MANLELWAEDRTNSGLVVNSLQSVTENQVILPKLFRRLVDYLENGDTVIMIELPENLVFEG